MSEILVDVSNESAATIESGRIVEAVRFTLADNQIAFANIHVAIVDNAQIWDLNVKFLDHDYPTDVLSFKLSEVGEALEGDIIVSQEMARQKAAEIGSPQWNANRELLLYIIHGALHLIGFEDHDPAQRERMQSRERRVLQQLDICHDAAFQGRVRSQGASP